MENSIDCKKYVFVGLSAGQRAQIFVHSAIHQFDLEDTIVTPGVATFWGEIPDEIVASYAEYVKSIKREAI